jgi:hypothetical protein
MASAPPRLGVSFRHLPVMGINPILYQVPAKRFIPVATMKNHATRILSKIESAVLFYSAAINVFK